MEVTSSAVAVAAASAGAASLATSLSPLVPFALGGLAIFSYKVSNDGMLFNLKNGLMMIGAAILLGYLIGGLVEPIGITMLEKLNIAVTEGSQEEVLVSVKKTIGFILGSLATSIFAGLFDKKSNITATIFERVFGMKLAKKETVTEKEAAPIKKEENEVH
jgi:hypothetical protein